MKHILNLCTQKSENKRKTLYTCTTHTPHIYYQCGIHLNKLKLSHFWFCPANKPLPLYGYWLVFQILDAQIKNSSVIPVNTSANYKIMLDRPASSIRFILHGNLHSIKVNLWYSLLEDIRICDVVSQFDEIIKGGGQLSRN